jgi:hypothetical protein
MTQQILAVLVPLASIMATVTAVFVRWAAGSRTAVRAAVVDFLLLMMVGMIAGGLVYELSPSRQSAVVGLWLASAVMSASVAVVFVTFLREARAVGVGPSPVAPRPPHVAFAGTVVGLVFLTEALMGWTFGLAAGSLPRTVPSGLLGATAQFGRIVVSPWFTFPMVAEMALSLLWLRRGLLPPLRRLLAVQPVVMLCSPPVLSGIAWVVGSTVGSGAGMAAAVGYVALLVYRDGRLSPPVARYAMALLLSFVAMGVGLALWAVDGSLLVFAVSVVAQMGIFLRTVLTSDAPSPAPGGVGAAPRPGPAALDP